MNSKKLKINKKNVAKLNESILDQIQGGKAAAGDVCVFKSSSCTIKEKETLS
ncbi:class I lanthipeptide [Sphingobacterium sp. Lzh-3]|uniref:class I lanthipeptide n=1 Tax=Sphingobacterium TaxID=28453 RepID=UPI0029534998|nr:class I lanthipeptide [Sphingobacterium sp. UGAL515B_05]WON95121.1 class I lanthipeptide [Sphingobacterium sp. UGAL515B_05]WON95122.1 class I lanthipeptide [Sphingobacterium sp. UGAL515B_05]